MSKSNCDTHHKPVLTLEEESTRSVVLGHPTTRRQIDAFWLANQMRMVWCISLLYATGFLCFFQKALTNFDEVSYVRQAATFAAGASTVDTIDPYTGLHAKITPSDYPPGTAALMAPFVWMVGWRGAFLLGLVAVLGCVLFTAKWIAETGRSPLWALVILGYVPTLVMARTAMSDVPSACFVAAGLYLFWPRNQTTPWRRLAAGFIAGASLGLREPTPILFALFFAGALLRRERFVLPLIAGGVAGLACRPLGAAVAYGNPWFVKIQFYGFSGLHIHENLVMYLTALLVMVPAGLILALGYRGLRWPELTSTVAIFVGMFIVYNYNAAASGGPKQWMLSLRFMIPLLPILAFAMAHTAPRWYTAFLRRIPKKNRHTWTNVARAGVAIWLIGVVTASLLVNWRVERWSALHQDVVAALYANTSAMQPIVADVPATIKFLNELYGRRMVAEVTGMSLEQVHTLIGRHKTIQIVFFERDDSDYWLVKSTQHSKFIDDVSSEFRSSLKLERRYPGLGVLRIWSVTGRS